MKSLTEANFQFQDYNNISETNSRELKENKRQIETLEKVYSYSDEIKDLIYNLSEKNSESHRDYYQSEIYSKENDTPYVVDLNKDDEKVECSNDEFPTNLTPDSDIFDTTLNLQECLSTNLISVRSSLESIDEIFSNPSIEEKEPLNADIATTKAQILYDSSSEFLRAYHYLKRTIQQRIYRIYYLKWLQYISQKPFSSTTTQTILQNGDIIPYNTKNLVKLNISTVNQNSSYSSSSCSNIEKNDYDIPQYNKSNTYRPQEALSFLKTYSSVTPFTDPINTNINKISQTILRSRSKPFPIQDYGHRSTTPSRSITQTHVLPSTQLPLLTKLGNDVTVIE